MYQFEKLPDISNWDTSRVVDMTQMFYILINIIALPDISKWKTGNVTTMKEMFADCLNLIFLPDISKWDISKVKDLSKMFKENKNLQVLPDISKWNTKNVINMSGMFLNCSSLTSLPEIGKWNINKLKEHLQMFEGCNQNLHIPPILRPDNRVRVRRIYYENHITRKRINAMEVRGGPYGENVQVFENPGIIFDIFDPNITFIVKGKFDVEVLLPYELFLQYFGGHPRYVNLEV